MFMPEKGASMSATKAFGYVRVSGKAQVEGDGFERQGEEIARYCQDNGIELVKVYEERGISGTKGEEDRPAFLEMVQAILANGVRAIVVEGLDRLAREVRIQESLILYLAAKEITLLSARTGENVTEAYMGDPMRRALVQIQAVFAELEKSLLVKKLRAARDRKRAREGRCEGRKNYAETDPGLLERIASLRTGGRTWAEVAEELTSQGIQTRTGRPWTAANVQVLISKARLAGRL